MTDGYKESLYARYQRELILDQLDYISHGLIADVTVQRRRGNTLVAHYRLSLPGRVQIQRSNAGRNVESNLSLH